MILRRLLAACFFALAALAAQAGQGFAAMRMAQAQETGAMAQIPPCHGPDYADGVHAAQAAGHACCLYLPATAPPTPVRMAAAAAPWPRTGGLALSSGRSPPVPPPRS